MTTYQAGAGRAEPQSGFQAPVRKNIQYPNIFFSLHIHSCQSKSTLKGSIWQDGCIWHLPHVCWVEHADHELHCSHLKQVWNLIFFYKFMVRPVFTFSLFDHIWARSHTHPPTAGSPGRWWRGRQVFLRLLTEPSCKQLNFNLPKDLDLSAEHLNLSCQTF